LEEPNNYQEGAKVLESLDYLIEKLMTKKGVALSQQDGELVEVAIRIIIQLFGRLSTKDFSGKELVESRRE
jgi:hypothetical protein